MLVCGSSALRATSVAPFTSALTSKFSLISFHWTERRLKCSWGRSRWNKIASLSIACHLAFPPFISFFFVIDEACYYTLHHVRRLVVWRNNWESLSVTSYNITLTTWPSSAFAQVVEGRTFRPFSVNKETSELSLTNWDPELRRQGELLDNERQSEDGGDLCHQLKRFFHWFNYKLI